jgi:hypothetical protein
MVYREKEKEDRGEIGGRGRRYKERGGKGRIIWKRSEGGTRRGEEKEE